MSDLVIQPAYPELPEAGFLTNLAIEEMSFPLFGTTHPHDIHDHINALWKRKHNRFSYDHSWIAKVDGQVAGIVTAMPTTTLEKADQYTFLHILQIRQWKIFKQLYDYAQNIKSLLTLEEGANDEYHVSMLAIMPDFHRQGIASELLQHIERIATHHGYSKMSLTVKSDNIGAQKLYTKEGFKTVAKMDKSPYHLYRMVKVLD